MQLAHSFRGWGFLAALAAVPGLSFANSYDQLFTPTRAASPDASVANQVIPWLADSRTFRFDADRLLRLMSAAPTDEAALTQVFPTYIELPTPDGTTHRFTLVESPILSPALRLRHPHVRTFRGQGIDDPAATMRFDFGPSGFHGIVLTPNGDYYIDPPRTNSQTEVLVYRVRSITKPFDFACLTGSAPLQRTPAGRSPGAPTPTLSGATLYTFRMAIQSTGNYTQWFTSRGRSPLDAMVTAVNRVSAVYERDMTTRFNIVFTRNFPDPATDPFTEGDVVAMLGQNQTSLDTTGTGGPGSAGYDIGHVVGTHFGGVANLSVVGIAGSKARGVSGMPTPEGTQFEVVLGHEIGHQFGGLHTFNSTSGACSGNRSSSAAYEPGSGSTILSYGVTSCSPEQVQTGSDLYFHTISFDNMLPIRNRTQSNGVQTPTGNTAPVVDAGANFTIPQSTPFRLTAVGSDANGDLLTYVWEQFNLGTASPTSDNTTRPLFRSRPPSTNPARVFPQLPDILSNASTPWEFLPNVNRSMRFRVTARDNRSGGGGSTYDFMDITVTGAPFAVTAPNTAVSWPGGTSQTVTWSVGGSTATNVRILLSTNGGTSYGDGSATVLVASTPNDGSETVTVPFAPTTQARIFVEPVGNIFFDVSNANFTITRPTISGTVTLNGFLPNPSGQVVDIEFRPVGGGAPLLGLNTMLGTTGAFSTPANIAPGTYDVFLRGRTFLWRAARNVAVSPTGASGLVYSLINGDVNRDNVVDGLDLAAVDLAFNTQSGDPGWNPQANLNGDAIVDGLDLALADANFNLSGDF